LGKPVFRDVQSIGVGKQCDKIHAALARSALGVVVIGFPHKIARHNRGAERFLESSIPFRRHARFASETDVAVRFQDAS